jgi:hypothetical protein
LCSSATISKRHCHRVLATLAATTKTTFKETTRNKDLVVFILLTTNSSPRNHKPHIATMRLPTLLLALLTSLNLTHALRKQPTDSVLLSKISSLTLRSGQKTSARRSSPIPQLQCVGGNAKSLYEVDVMRCTNAGSDYDDDNVQWTCKASLPAEFKLGSTDVSCEGYDSPEDPYVLKGSCGVSYRLVLTEEGERKYGHRADEDGRSGSSSTGEKLIFWAFFTCKFFMFSFLRFWD